MQTASVIILCFMCSILIIFASLMAMSIRIVREGQSLSVYRLGSHIGDKGPGLVFLIPFIDRGELKEGEVRKMGGVEIVQQGPSGKILYSENGRVCEFYWEFSSGDTLVTVWIPAQAEWDAKYPWAAGRRTEILKSMAQEVRRRQAPTSRIVWEDTFLHFKQK